MMRISPVGYMFDSEKEVIENVTLATKPSHNSEESIEWAKIIALIIYYARQGWPKKEILRKLNIQLQYKPFQKFNTTYKAKCKIPREFTDIIEKVYKTKKIEDIER